MTLGGGEMRQKMKEGVLDDPLGRQKGGGAVRGQGLRG